MSVTDARCQLVAALPTWAAYAAVPSPNTLAELLQDADARALRDCLPAALARQFDASGDWRTAQHLANELLLAGQSTEVAFYYADRALRLSGGNVFARLSVARCFWVQRFPEAVLHHVRVLRHDVRRVSPPARRQQLCDEIADLYANVWCYSGRIDLASPWIQRLLAMRRCRLDTIMQIFAVAFGEHRAFELETARRLAPYADRLNDRNRSRVRIVLRRHLLATLRGRQ